LVLTTHVDDTLLCGLKDCIKKFYADFKKYLKIEELGRLKKHLGVWWAWKRDEHGAIYLEATMPKMIVEIEEAYRKAIGKAAKPATTPGFPGKTLKKSTEDEPTMLDDYRSIVGKIMYLTTKVGPDLANATRELASHMSNPDAEHWKALERCVGYLSKWEDSPLTFRAPRELRSISYCDANFAQDEDDRRSISGRINTLGGMITQWSSKKQQTVALSTTESEWISYVECCQEAMFTNMLLEELFHKKETAIIYEDNMGAIFLIRNQQTTARTKHLDYRKHFVRDLHERKEVEARFVRSDNNASDPQTKNTIEKIHTKHTRNIRNGTLECSREDVKSDPSVSIKDRDQEVVTDDVTLPVIKKTLGNDHSPTG
jgi:hypothetical protein